MNHFFYSAIVVTRFFVYNLFDYATNTTAHPDIEALDVEGGRWFKCKFCKNPKGVPLICLVLK